jgi:hypothetical protein
MSEIALAEGRHRSHGLLSMAQPMRVKLPVAKRGRHRSHDRFSTAQPMRVRSPSHQRGRRIQGHTLYSSADESRDVGWTDNGLRFKLRQSRATVEKIIP